MVQTTAARSRATGALTSRETRRFDVQNWRSPRNSFRRSTRLRVSAGTSGLATTANSAPPVEGLVSAAGASVASRKNAQMKSLIIRKPSKGETGLRECPIDSRLARPAEIAILHLDGRERRHIIPHPDDRGVHAGYEPEHRIALGNVDVFKTIVRLPQPFEPRQAVGRLD